MSGAKGTSEEGMEEAGKRFPTRGAVIFAVAGGLVALASTALVAVSMTMPGQGSDVSDALGQMGILLVPVVELFMFPLAYIPGVNLLYGSTIGYAFLMAVGGAIWGGALFWLGRVARRRFKR